MKDMLAVVLVLRAVYEVAHYRVETPWKLIEEWRKYLPMYEKYLTKYYVVPGTYSYLLYVP